MNWKKISFLTGVFLILFLIVVLVGMGKNEDYRPAAKVMFGIDNIEQHLRFFNNKQVGLITNQTGVIFSFATSIDVFKTKTSLKLLFSPRYGIRDSVGAGRNVSSYLARM